MIILKRIPGLFHSLKKPLEQIKPLWDKRLIDRLSPFYCARRVDVNGKIQGNSFMTLKQGPPKL